MSGKNQIGSSLFSLICIMLLIINTCKCDKINQLAQFLFKLNITDHLGEVIINNYKISKDNNFLATTEEKERSLKIPDFALNAVLYLIEKAVKLDFHARNDSYNPLPLNIDSDSLSIIVDEFKKYQPNIPMTLRIYHDANRHPTPSIKTDPQGLLLSINFGMEFGTFLDDVTEPVNILSFDANLHLKIQLETVNNKFSLGLKYVKVKDILINHDDLNVDVEKLKMTLGNFLYSVYDGVDEQLTDVDVLKMLNDFILSNFSKLDILMDYGYIMITIG